MKEKWKKVPGHEDIYEASTMGKIRSIDRYDPVNGQKPRKRCGVLLTQSYRPDGYCYVGLRGKKELTHRIIAKTFLGDSKLFVDHINGIKDDNRLQNLEYVTPLENARRYSTMNPSKYSSKHRGVYFVKSRKKWRVSRSIDGVETHLGYYEQEEIAAKAYAIGLNLNRIEGGHNAKSN